MTDVSVIECPGCGFPQSSASARNCEQCGNLLIVQSLTFLDGADEKSVRIHLKNYRARLKDDPDDCASHIGMGICYLTLKLYDRASEELAKAVDLAPESGDPYYYAALALLQGKRPRVHTHSCIKKVEEMLHAAEELDGTKHIHCLLWAAVKRDYYDFNGMIPRPPSVDELLSRASQRERNDGELQCLERLLPRECWQGLMG
jgi:tetratricopeptide (TPR) repeat protein